MINSEYLAIIAIFTTGTFFGIKIREGFYNLKEYLKEIKGLE